MNYTDLNIFELKIKLDTNIKELRHVVFEREMLHIPKVVSATTTTTKKSPSKNQVSQNAPVQSAIQPVKTGGYDEVPDQMIETDAPQKTTIYALNRFPYFTPDVEYPRDILKKFNYDELMAFFFNKTKFRDVLIQARNKQSSSLDGIEIDKQQNIIKSNVLIMLTLLFPTKFPQINDTANSYDLIIKTSVLTSVAQNIPGFFNSGFTYFKFPQIQGRVFTVSKTVWINDFLNHPDYNIFIRKYIENNIAAKYAKKQNVILIARYNKLLDQSKNSNEITRKIQKLEKENRKLDQLISYPFETLHKIIRGYGSNVMRHKSSNFILQNMLEEKVTSDEYNRFLKYLISFIGNEASENSEEEKKEYNKLLDVGVSFVNENEVEINVLVDFIDKTVNDDTVKKQDCQFMGEYLGTELEAYLKDKGEDALKTVNSEFNTKWDIQRNRPEIVIGKEIGVTTEAPSYQANIEHAPFERERGFNVNDDVDDEKKIEEADKLYTWITNTNEVKDRVSDVTFFEEWEGELPAEFHGNPVVYIMKKDRELYSLIKDIYKNIDTKNIPLLTIKYANIKDKLNRLDGMRGDPRFIKICKILLKIIENVIGGKGGEAAHSKRKSRRRGTKNNKKNTRKTLRK